MNHPVSREAPITPEGWAEIEKEAKRTLRALLSARRVVDFRGPLAGARPMSSSAAPIPSPRRAAARCAGRLRRIQPLVELRIPFEMSRAGLDAIDRGARDPISTTSRPRHARSLLPRIALSSTATRAPRSAASARCAPNGGAARAHSHPTIPAAVATALTKRATTASGTLCRGAERAALQDLASRTEAAIRS